MLAVSIIVPTFNERKNISLLTEEIFTILEKYSFIDAELIIVDDNSPDGTGEVAEQLKEKYPVKIIHRSKKMGLGSAVLEGFNLSGRDFLGVMDADLSHDPAILPQLIENLKHYDLVIGSRYHPESLVENWPLHRKLISRIGVFLSRKITRAKDPLSGYFFLHKKVVSNLTLTSHGYKILLEILFKGNYSTVNEIPFIFRDRQFSTSKLSLSEYLLFLKQIIHFSFLRIKKGF